MMQLTKCKLLVQGVASPQEVHRNVLECIDADQSLHSLGELMDEAGNDVIQVEGIKCVGAPQGMPDVVLTFVGDKASKILEHVEKVKLASDPVIHCHLLLRLSKYSHRLSRNVSPLFMANAPCNAHHI